MNFIVVPVDAATQAGIDITTDRKSLDGTKVLFHFNRLDEVEVLTQETINALVAVGQIMTTDEINASSEWTIPRNPGE